MIREVYTIVWREVKKFLADKADLVLGFVWPLLVIFIIGIGVDSFIRMPGLDINYTAFLGPGILAVIAMASSLNVGFSIIEDREKFIRELLVAPIRRESIIIGKILGGVITRFSLLLLVIIVFLAYVQNLGILNIAAAIFMMLLIVFSFYGFGIVVASLFKNVKVYNQIMAVFVGVMVFLSGAFFPIGNLPKLFKAVIYVNPLAYGVDGLRWALVGFHELNIFTNILVLTGFGLLVTIVGAYLFERSVSSRT